MKPLTFKGVLKAYLSELSLCGSFSVRKLEKEVDSNLRLLEPLALYAKMTLTEEQLSRFKNKRVRNALKDLKSWNKHCRERSFLRHIRRSIIRISSR